jgi:hypothetical protein
MTNAETTSLCSSATLERACHTRSSFIGSRITYCPREASAGDVANEVSYLLATLRIPLNDEQGEFDGQVLALAKLIIDSLNEDEIGKWLPSKIAEEKGIAKFERFLAMNGIAAEPVGTYMRRLYGLRHGVGHRKGDGYERAAEFFGVGKQPLRDVFVEILIAATELLQLLDRKLIGGKED